MVIQFDVAGDPAEFEWKSVTGAAELRVGDDTIALQSGLDPRSYFSLRTTTTWTCHPDGHDVTIVKVRSRWFGGFRPSSYSITVDDAVVAQARGH